MRWRRERRPKDNGTGLSEFELMQLATYNAERARGIVHTPAWQAQMAELQARFDDAQWERRAVSWGLDSSQA
jgi:hypothetical protein